MDKQIRQAIDHQLGKEPLFQERLKREIRGRVNSSHRHKPKRTRLFVAVPIAILFFLLAGGYLFSQLSTSLSPTHSNQSSEIPIVTPDDDDLLIEWGQDNMDNGNHDYITFEKGPLVVDPNIAVWTTGDVVYYTQPQLGDETTSPSIGRIVGMPGDTIEIVDGQVILNEEPVSAFYGQARSYGLTEEAYFEKVNPENVDVDSMKEYFATSMDKVTVPPNSYFILGDNWWRGWDSKEFGPVSLTEFIGKVEGYAKEDTYEKASAQSLEEVFPQIKFEEIRSVSITSIAAEGQAGSENSAYELTESEIEEFHTVLTSQKVRESLLKEDTGLQFAYQVIIYTKDQELFLLVNEDVVHPIMTTFFYNAESTELYTYIDELMK